MKIVCRQLALSFWTAAAAIAVFALIGLAGERPCSGQTTAGPPVAPLSPPADQSLPAPTPTVLPPGFPDTLPTLGVPAAPVHAMPPPEAFTTVFRLHQTIADAVGDAGELTSIGGFFTHPEDDGLWFVDARFLILEDAHWPDMQYLAFAGNFGLGRRWLELGNGDVLGLSVWYDFDHAQPTFVHQASVAAELLGEVWDMRANGYFPIGTQRGAVSYPLPGPPFLPTPHANVALMTGFDIEAGRRLPGWLGENGVSLYSGVYYYQADANLNTFGAEERLEWILSDTITFDARVTTDSLFKTNFAFGLTYSLPAASKCKTCAKANDDYWRLIEPVQRNRTLVKGRQ